MSRHTPDIDPQLQAEIDAALGDASLDDLIDESPARSAASAPTGIGHGPALWADESSFEPGNRLVGTIFRVGAEEVFVELGPRIQGVCPLVQFTEHPREGEQIEFTVVRFDRDDAIVHLSRAGAVQKGDWDLLQAGQVVEAKVSGMNKGGLEAQVGTLRAFIPAGQVDLHHVENLDAFVGETLTCEVLELNREKKNLILSRRAVLARERAQQREETLANLAVGQIVEGTVRKLMPFGAFVDLGGVDGLIHISDLAYGRVNKPQDVVHERQVVQVQVLRIDLENDRISLGLKQTQADPFLETTGRLQEGEEVTGRVTRLADFGAFVELAPGVEGLIHISELAHERVNRVNQVVKPDEIVRVKVLGIDADGRRISLSLKATKAKEEESQHRTEDRAMARLRAKWGDANRPLKGGL